MVIKNYLLLKPLNMSTLYTYNNILVICASQKLFISHITAPHIHDMNIPYSGKFLKGLIFENFENRQAFSKIFFRN